MSAPSRRRGGLVWVVIIVAVLIAASVRPSAHRPFDLASTQADGYRGLKLLLEETGTDVTTIDAADLDAGALSRFDVAFVPVADAVDQALLSKWNEFVVGGGRLVLGTHSDLGAPSSIDDESFSTDTGVGVGSTRDPQVCTIDALDGAETIRSSFFASDLLVIDADSCYGDGSLAQIVAERRGEGEVVTLASPDLFTNSLMGAPEAGQKKVTSVPDNAVVAERLLGHGVGGELSDGPTRLAIVTRGVAAAPIDGSKTLTDFMPSGVKLGLLELFAAFGFYALFRGRRHGRVVSEPVPVSIAGSSFVEAVGDLLERQGSHARAAEVLRAAECRELAQRLGVPLGIDRSALATVVAGRTGRDVAAVRAMLTDPIDSESSLVALSRELDSLRQEALHV